MGERLIDQDTRFWEVFNEQGESLGIFMYWDLIVGFAGGHGVLDTALTNLKDRNHTWNIVGDICPLEADSPIPIIQQKKVEFRRRERERDKKHAKKRGFKLESTIKFGKHSGTKIKDLIDKHPSYWSWLVSKNILLLHPETKEYASPSPTTGN